MNGRRAWVGATLLGLCAGIAAAGGYEKLAPYDGVRWKGGAPQVRVEKTWYSLVSIDGADVRAILAFAQKTWPGKWRKRLGGAT